MKGQDLDREDVKTGLTSFKSTGCQGTEPFFEHPYSGTLLRCFSSCSWVTRLMLGVQWKVRGRKCKQTPWTMIGQSLGNKIRDVASSLLLLFLGHVLGA